MKTISSPELKMLLGESTGRSIINLCGKNLNTSYTKKHPLKDTFQYIMAYNVESVIMLILKKAKEPRKGGITNAHWRVDARAIVTVLNQFLNEDWINWVAINNTRYINEENRA